MRVSHRVQNVVLLNCDSSRSGKFSVKSVSLSYFSDVFESFTVPRIVIFITRSPLESVLSAFWTDNLKACRKTSDKSLAFTLADVSSILTFVQILRLKRETCQGRENSGDVAPEEAVCIPPAEDAAKIPVMPPLLHLSYSSIDFVYSCNPPCSVVTFEQMVKRILSRCRSRSVNSTFLLILTTCLTAMVEDNTNTGLKVLVISFVTARQRDP